MKKKQTKNFFYFFYLPFKYIISGFLKVIKWFSVGLFKTIMFVGEYLIDLLSYTATGIYASGKFLLKYLWIFIKYLSIGIYYFLRLEITGLSKLGMLIINFFKYFGLGIYYSIDFIFIRLFTGIFNWVKGEARANKEARLGTKNKKDNNKGKFKSYLLKKYQDIPIVKSFLAKREAEREILLIDLNSDDAKRSEVQQSFRYIAKNKEGKMVRGVFNGYSKLDVNSFLINEGFEVYKIETSKFINFIYGQMANALSRLNNKDLIFWLTQLSTYLKSGIPLTNAVKILGNQMGKTGSRKRLFDSVVYELTMGESFSSALEKQGNVFPSLLVNMIKAAEATGELEETLAEMAEYYREVEKTRKQMVSAMTYPLIILVFAFGVVVFIMLYVIPQFVKVYEQAGITISGVTLALVNLSLFLKNYIGVILAIIFLTIIVLILLYKNIKGIRILMQTFLMRFPVIGKIIIYKEMTIFTKTFASLLKNNVFITESIDILSKITKNEIYRDIMFNTISNIAKGDKISDAFKDHWAVPEVAYFMIVTGESTGELANMLQNVSDYYQDMHRNAVNGIKTLIEPVLIVFLAAIVGVVILAVILPMFDLYSSIEL
ncbi:MAG TPA: type II secretion system F family protein [Bacilli bacterium]|nr:type II secretion system F family protein [Bacilli bacterium]